MRRAPLVGLALAAAVSTGGCGTGGLAEGGSASAGQPLFTEKCGSCHTLAAAGTQGTIGPNLDDAFAVSRAQGLGESTIREVVREQIEYPLAPEASPDTPPMPADLVKGQDADSVATYVASVAGKPGAAAAAPRGGQAGGGGTDGKSIFSSNCASCHTLKAAGSSGTIGPNLDESKPSVELATDRVTNGKGAMPSFKGRLTNDQIKAVAEYVSKNAGK